MEKKNTSTSKGSKRQQQNQHQRRLTNLGLTIGGIAFIVILIASASGSNLDYRPRFDVEPIYGNPDAKVSIIEYAAYGCEACKLWHESGILEDIVAEYDGQVNLIYRDNPIILPAYSQMAAELAQCALDQSNEVYWRFHNLLYTDARQGFATQDELIRLAGQAGADTAALSACADAGTHRDTVKYDANRAAGLGLRGTPAFFVNDERLFTLSPDELRRLIDAELAKS